MINIGISEVIYQRNYTIFINKFIELINWDALLTKAETN